MAIWKKYLVCFITMFSTAVISYAAGESGMISGKVLSLDGEPVDYATVFLKGTTLSCSTNEKGLYHISAPAGDYTIVFSSVGFEKHEAKVRIKSHERAKLIETIFSQLTDQFLVIRNYAKITNGLFARIIGKISALTILQYVNFISDKPIGRIKYALN